MNDQDSTGAGDGPAPSLFPDLTRSEVHEATRRRWNLDGPAPTPRPGWLSCPVCGAEKPQPRWWKWHLRPRRHTIRWRCDVSFKCTVCAAVWLHGVVLDQDTWESRPLPNRDSKAIPWREVRDLLDDA